MPDRPRLVRIEWHPSPKVLRQFGFIVSALFGAWALTRYAHEPGASLAAGALALASALVALVWPRAHRYPYVALSCITYPLALLCAWLALLGLFFGVITPAGWLARRL